MAKPTYTELTPEKCKEMLIAVLDLEPEATDEEIQSAYDEEMGEDQTAQEPSEGADEAATETAPNEDQMPMKAAPKYKGSAMTVLVRPKR